MLVALTTAQKLGIAAFAAVFILFALASAFLLPARDPNFPGRRMPLFVGVTAVLFVAMMAAILAFARESEGEDGHEAGPAATETETQGPTETEGQTETEGETETEAGTETQPPAEGDPAAGEEVFASAGCGSCHTLSAAGSSGTIGPNLDESRPDHELVVDRVTNGMGAMPAFADQLSEEQIQDVAAYVVESAGSS